MSGAITLKGADKLRKRLRRIVPEAEKALRLELEQAAEMVQADIQRAIDEPKTGTLYALVGHRLRRVAVKPGHAVPANAKRLYRASAPGEPPSRAKNVLYRSIKTKKRHKKFEPRTRVIASPPFSRLVEATRPFMGPAYRRNAPKIIEKLKSATRTAIKRTK